MDRLGGPTLRQALHRHFDAVTLARGRVYQQQNRVQSCELTPATGAGWVVNATVRGSRPAPYAVTAQITPTPNSLWQVAGLCTCPLVADCKHVAATLLQVASHWEDIPVDDELMATVPPRPANVLEPGLQFWLQRLAEAARPKPELPPPAAAENAERLLYILRPQTGRLKLDLAIARPLKKGGYGQARPYAFPHLMYATPPGAAVTPADDRLIRRIMLAQPTMTFYEVFLEGPGGAELLPDILATGRCHWRGYGRKHQVLTGGAPRPARPVWNVDAKGFQRPAFHIEPPANDWLPLSPPWYVDEATGECGVLVTNLPAALANDWLKAPAVAPDHAAVVARQMDLQVPGLTLPAPQTIEITTLAQLTTTPCLRLYSTRLKPIYTYGLLNRGNGERVVSFARLEFAYEGMRLDPAIKDACLENYTDGKLVRLHRNPRQEQAAKRSLHQTGLQTAERILFDLQLGTHAQALAFEEETKWYDFVQHTVPDLRRQGWEVAIEESFPFQIVQPEDWFTDATAEAVDNDWFGVELGVMLDGQKVNLLPTLLQLLQADPQLLQPEALARMPADAGILVPLPDGRKVMFPAQRARQMLGTLLELLNPNALNPDGRLRLPKLRALELAAETGWRWLGTAELQELAVRLRGFAGIQPVPPPKHLGATLRPYQQDGLNWLQFLREYELAGILADDMGLGKTVQTLAHLLVEKHSGRMDRPSLVIAPTSLMTNWRLEAERFAPDLRVLVLHGLDRKQHFDRIAEHDLIVTSYPLLPRDAKVLQAQEFHYVILDEAQFIKNPRTQYAQIVCALNARHHLCLTGTPMENHLGELWSLFNFLLPGFLGDELRFNRSFRRPIEKGGDEDRRKLLARRVGPFILRRKKDEVVRELPPKTEIVRKVELTGAQRDLYESVRLAMHQRVRAEVAKKGLSRAHIIILDALLKLRQICCHPQLLSLPAAKQVTESAKLELLLDLLPEMLAEGRRILLFSQFTSMLAILQTELAQRNIPYLLLTGDTTDRATPVARFQSGEVPLFLISLKAGGTGLNLTAADTVIHYDPWWNPAVENQATDRAHRIGQAKKVFVYKLLTEGTVEEKIAALQLRKRELVEGLLNEERRENLKLAAEDLDVLFAPLPGK